MEQNEINGNNDKEAVSLKSFDEKENNNDIIDIMEKSDNNLVTFKLTQNILRLNIKTIKKIFSLFFEKEQLADMYLDHITISIIDKDNEQSINKDSKDEDIELDTKYRIILEKTSFFYINIENKKGEKIDEHNTNNNNKMAIKKKSLKKIFNLLNGSLISMSDYINLIILYLKDESQNDLAKLIFEQKILGKYSKEVSKNIEFKGKKVYDSNLNIPLKSESQNIYTIDNLFNKVLDYLDDYDEESSFSDNIINLIIPRKNIDEDLIQSTKVCFVKEGILTDINSSNNEVTKKEIKKNSRENIIGNNNQNICDNDFCNGICFIF